MKKNKIVFIIFFIIFIVSLLIAFPSIVNLITGNFVPSEVFKQNPFENTFKSVFLRKYPEWKPIEEELENLVPNTSANVSVSTVYGATEKSLELHITLVTDKEFTDKQLSEAKDLICKILDKHNTDYKLIIFTATNLKSYSREERISCSI